MSLLVVKGNIVAALPMKGWYVCICILYTTHYHHMVRTYNCSLMCSYTLPTFIFVPLCVVVFQCLCVRMHMCVCTNVFVYVCVYTVLYLAHVHYIKCTSRDSLPSASFHCYGAP